MARDTLYAHFHPDEHEFVDKALEWIERAARHHEHRLTDFLDPRQRSIVRMLANRESDVQAVFDGGHADAERTRAWIAPDYAYLADADFDMRVLSVTSDDARLAELEHGDFLGAVLALGIKREKIGDIHVHGDVCHIVVAGPIGEYLRLQLHAVHRVKVMTELLASDKLIPVRAKLEEASFSVASLRLDGIVGEAARLSRAKAVQPIRAGRCRVNWRVEDDPSALLKEGDVVSLQGYGRFKLVAVEGTTRSGRIRVRIGRFV